MCPLNTFAPAQSDAITDCQCLAGYYSLIAGQNAITCTACEMGKYKGQTGPVACINCPANTYSNTSAATSNATCNTCSAYSVSPSGSSSASMCSCNLGYYRAPKSYANLARSCGPAENQACVVSQSTTYEPQYPASNAVDGNLDTFSFTQSGVEQWFRIDFGRSVNVQSISISIRTAGELVYAKNIQVRVGNVDAPTSQNPACYIHSGSLDTLGSSQPWSRNIACTTSLEGQYLYYFNPANGGVNHLTFTELSPQGFIDGVPGQTACSACAIGKYKDAIGSALCISCPANTFSGRTAQTNASTCTPCFDNSVSPAGSDAIDDCSCSSGYEFS
jgi:hypothetical protein